MKLRRVTKNFLRMQDLRKRKEKQDPTVAAPGSISQAKSCRGTKFRPSPLLQAGFVELRGARGLGQQLVSWTAGPLELLVAGDCY